MSFGAVLGFSAALISIAILMAVGRWTDRRDKDARFARAHRYGR